MAFGGGAPNAACGGALDPPCGGAGGGLAEPGGGGEDGAGAGLAAADGDCIGDGEFCVAEGGFGLRVLWHEARSRAAMRIVVSGSHLLTAVLFLDRVRRFSFCPIEKKANFELDLFLIQPSSCKMRIADLLTIPCTTLRRIRQTSRSAQPRGTRFCLYRTPGNVIL